MTTTIGQQAVWQNAPIVVRHQAVDRYGLFRSDHYSLGLTKFVFQSL
jgi:hypothetical protein